MTRETKEIVTFTFAVLSAIVIVYLAFAGLWWIVLWSFDFIIPFSWTQPIGLLIISAMMSGGDILSISTNEVRTENKNCKDCKKNKKD